MKKYIFTFLLILLVLLSSFGVGAIGARSAVVINGETGEILYAVNENERLPMASTTKIMTAYTVAKNVPLDKTVKVTFDAVNVEGTKAGLMPGDTVTYRDLIICMLLPSGNDAANVAAVSVSGSKEKFSRLMNKTAKKAGLKNSCFVTPSGLDANGHYTTAYDLALLTKKALENEDIRTVVAMKSAEITVKGQEKERTLKLYNHNKLLRMYDDVIGVKTGYTKSSGRCLVSAGKKDGKYVIAVTLNDKNDWNDHRALLDLGYEKFTFPKTDENTEKAVKKQSVKIKSKKTEPYKIYLLRLGEILRCINEG